MLYLDRDTTPRRNKKNAQFTQLPADATTAEEVLQLLEFWRELRINLVEIQQIALWVGAATERESSTQEDETYLPYLIGWTAIINSKEYAIHIHRVSDGISWRPIDGCALPGNSDFRWFTLRDPNGRSKSCWGQFFNNPPSVSSSPLNLYPRHERVEKIIEREAKTRGIDAKPLREFGLEVRQHDEIPIHFCVDSEFYDRLPEWSGAPAEVKRKCTACYLFCCELEEKLCSELEEPEVSEPSTPIGLGSRDVDTPQTVDDLPIGVNPSELERLKKQIIVCRAKQKFSWRALESEYEISEKTIRRWAKEIGFDLKQLKFVSPSAQVSALLDEQKKSKGE